MKPKNVMTPGEMWFRVGFGTLLIVIGFLIPFALLIIIGVISLAWTIFRAVRQVKAAERLQAERNARR